MVATVVAASLERAAADGKRFVPVGEYLTRARKSGYLEDEWVASGVDDKGRPYRTHVFVRRPEDPNRFSGIVIVEPLHASSIAPLFMYCSPYILRSGHGWACVASQKTALEDHVKPANPERYADLEIGTSFEPGREPVPTTAGQIDGDLHEFLARLTRINEASGTILAQVGAALRSPAGPFGPVRTMVLVGHSQTGWVTADYLETTHASKRLEGGAPVYDGLFPAGFPRESFGPRDVPLIQLLSDGDVFDSEARLLRKDKPGRHYRRPDSDSPDDRYRLYELAGFPHYGTRYPPHSSTEFSGARQGGLIKPTDTMNSLPYSELFNMALDHLIKWSADGIAPPRAERIELASDGRRFAKDEHGNTRGGVRCAQMDVPHATYQPVPLDDNGEPVFATVGTQMDFEAAKMRSLYGTPDAYAELFNRRLDELVKQGWFLADDAATMRAEADAQRSAEW